VLDVASSDTERTWLLSTSSHCKLYGLKSKVMRARRWCPIRIGRQHDSQMRNHVLDESTVDAREYVQWRVTDDTCNLAENHADRG
jgi:hypothetical protein